MTPEFKSEEILINVTPQETRVAVVEDGVLQEIWIERHRIHGLVGNVYKGRVCRVMPGMDAAFVDIGLEKSAFLHASDVSIVDGEEVLTEENGTEPITKLLHQDQNVLVQVIKDPIGSKGARLTTHITVPSRHLVLMPYSKNIGISSRIEDENDRQSLRQLLERLSVELGDGYGHIVRTVAETASEDAIRRDMTYLRNLWGLVMQSTEEVKPGSLVYEDLPLALRTLRDLVGDDVERVRIDSSRVVRKAMEFAASYVPHIIDRIEHYARFRPIFDIYGIEDEIQKALERKVQLKSGGYLIIDQTEAMTTCDVNTGAFLGHRNLEETIFKTNLEAAQSIARQLRLRNLGGIIIIDFIDMNDEQHKQQVLQALQKHLEKDHAKSQLCAVSPLGLIEMTRKRTRESLEHILCQPCHICSGRGTLKTPETVCNEIFREILREARLYAAKELLVLASPQVIDVLLDEESASMAELEESIHIPIRLQVEELYTQEQFDVVLI